MSKEKLQQQPAGATTLQLDPATLMRGPRELGGEDHQLPRVFFTADLHFNHENIILPDYCPERGRLFGSVLGMNEALIERWNARVSAGDDVIVIGDLSMGLPELIPSILQRLNGTIWLIEGNHDRRPSSRRRILQAAVAHYIKQNAFMEVADFGTVVIAHHPIPGGLSGTGLPGGARLQLCGHVHHHWVQRGLVVNVGVDVRDFEPKTLSEILAVTNLSAKDI